MALKAGIFRSELVGLDENDQPLYDRAVSEEYFQHYLGEFISTGVYPNGFVASCRNDMTLEIGPGSVYIENHYAYDDDPQEFIFEAPVSQYRTDRIVIRLNRLARSCTMEIKKGAVGNATYNPPVLQRDEDIYELGIYDVSLRPGQTAISQANVTDLRMNNELCGMVFNPLQQIDTTALYRQIQEDLAEFQNVSQKEFEDWVAEIKGILDQEAAGNLLNKINENKALVGGVLRKTEENATAIGQVKNDKLDKTGGTITSDLTVNGSLYSPNTNFQVLTTNAAGRLYKGMASSPNLDVYGSLKKSGYDVITTAGGQKISGNLNVTGRLTKDNLVYLPVEVSTTPPELRDDNNNQLGYYFEFFYAQKIGNLVKGIMRFTTQSGGGEFRLRNFPWATDQTQGVANIIYTFAERQNAAIPMHFRIDGQSGLWIVWLQGTGRTHDAGTGAFYTYGYYDMEFSYLIDKTVSD